MMLYNRTVLSFGDLQASVNNAADTEQCHTQCLITHLLTNFLLFSSGGHMIAQEFISHVSDDCLFFFLPSLSKTYLSCKLRFKILHLKKEN